MQISPNYWTENWEQLNLSLDSPEETWKKAIIIFQDRIEGRYFNYIDQLDRETFSGFAVMALSCLLIETLQQFIEGVDSTPSGKSGEYFIQFLTKTSFNEFFDIDKARIFYKQIRCGILHQAEVEGSSLIRTDSSLSLAQFTEDRRGLIINRRSFYHKLKEVFNDYVGLLSDGSNAEIRRNFIYKMNYICRLPNLA